VRTAAEDFQLVAALHKFTFLRAFVSKLRGEGVAGREREGGGDSGGVFIG
jgi:hypothetical protein